jgi:hypothetical protein
VSLEPAEIIIILGTAGTSKDIHLRAGISSINIVLFYFALYCEADNFICQNFLISVMSIDTSQNFALILEVLI